MTTYTTNDLINREVHQAERHHRHALALQNAINHSPYDPAIERTDDYLRVNWFTRQTGRHKVRVITYLDQSGDLHTAFNLSGDDEVDDPATLLAAIREATDVYDDVITHLK